MRATCRTAARSMKEGRSATVRSMHSDTSQKDSDQGRRAARGGGEEVDVRDRRRRVHNGRPCGQFKMSESDSCGNIERLMRARDALADAAIGVIVVRTLLAVMTLITTAVLIVRPVPSMRVSINMMLLCKCVRVFVQRVKPRPAKLRENRHQANDRRAGRPIQPFPGEFA